MADFLLEIGTEELPAGMISGMAQDLLVRVTEGLRGEALAPMRHRTIAAPRRIGFFLEGLPDWQEDRRETVVGPALAIARDAGGVWTKAAEGFARKQGAEVAQLREVDGPKGPCVGFDRHLKGRKTSEILAEVVPVAVEALYLPKAMKWGAGDFQFVRPVRWVVALLDGSVVPMAIKGVQAGNASRGRRVFGAESVPVPSSDSYFASLERELVVADPEERKGRIRKQLEERASSVGGRCPLDEDLLDTVTFLCEWGHVLVGTIPERFLSLPTAVMGTCLREHQRFFVVVDGGGKPLPHFLSVVDSPADAEGFIRRGNENVTVARLTDAEFFYEHDKAVSLERRLEELKGIVYHPKLGTYYDKALRMEKYARELAVPFAADPDRAARAAKLCKCDLASLLVQEKEFTALQGVAGGLYATAQGEAPEVAQAIGEHYDPAGSTSAISKVVALADKLDTLMEFFRIGQAPTGSKDPFALRRSASVAIGILCDPGAGAGADISEIIGRWSPKGSEGLLQFLGDRARHKWEGDGYAYDEVNAVLATGLGDLADSQARLKALHGVRNEAAEDFDHLSTSFKRVRNILKSSPARELDPALFGLDSDREGAAERALFSACSGVESEAVTRLDRRDYAGALRLMATLRPAVDRFFENVLVMCDPEGRDPAKTAVQNNRLALLQRLVGLFNRVADLSEIVPLATPS